MYTQPKERGASLVWGRIKIIKNQVSKNSIFLRLFVVFTPI